MPKVTRPIEIVNDRLKKVRWKEFVCGWGAACVNITVTYPINKIILRQMLSGVTIKNAFSQLRTEGVFYLYRGMLPPLMQKTLSLSIMFGVYEELSLDWLPALLKQFLCLSSEFKQC
ncbi:solute carrier family 25 member 51 isoform X2 [Photinus pyralis]|uniref:solute carrier family 25 member 51 isoform X2 n=1 Tax=Photinus pyralis TaxID=7054 RepID=UPI00126724E9|nr:solute carrier family 25 member 51 isoform X2 [Photinus pyralis]